MADDDETSVLATISPANGITRVKFFDFTRNISPHSFDLLWGALVEERQRTYNDMSYPEQVEGDDEEAARLRFIAEFSAYKGKTLSNMMESAKGAMGLWMARLVTEKVVNIPAFVHDENKRSLYRSLKDWIKETGLEDALPQPTYSRLIMAITLMARLKVYEDCIVDENTAASLTSSDGSIGINRKIRLALDAVTVQGKLNREQGLPELEIPHELASLITHHLNNPGIHYSVMERQFEEAGFKFSYMDGNKKEDPRPLCAPFEVIRDGKHIVEWVIQAVTPEQIGYAERIMKSSFLVRFDLGDVSDATRQHFESNISEVPGSDTA